VNPLELLRVATTVHEPIPLLLLGRTDADGSPDPLRLPHGDREIDGLPEPLCVHQGEIDSTQLPVGRAEALVLHETLRLGVADRETDGEPVHSPELEIEALFEGDPEEELRPSVMRTCTPEPTLLISLTNSSPRRVDLTTTVDPAAP